LLLFLLGACAAAAPVPSVDHLPSWNEGPVKQTVLGFVGEVTDAGGDNFVPVEERVAVFDNDGTLWSEKPTYFQLLFILDRARALATDHPEWRSQMLEWTTTGDGPRLGLIVHHTDAQREWAYDRQSGEGRLDRALGEAPDQGWTVIDMARDWRVVFPPQR
jgi:hypothetical protein